MSSDPTAPFARFFRAVEGRQVGRYGTARKTQGNNVIGGRWVDQPDARPDRITNRRPRKLVINTSIVVAITHAEAARFRREYNRAVSQGSLEEVTRKDYQSYLAEDARKAKETRAKVEAEAKAKAKAEAEAEAKIEASKVEAEKGQEAKAKGKAAKAAKLAAQKAAGSSDAAGRQTGTNETTTAAGGGPVEE